MKNLTLEQCLLILIAVGICWPFFLWLAVLAAQIVAFLAGLALVIGVCYAMYIGFVRPFIK